MVTLITPTGDRIEAFELCRRWIASQSQQPDQWIVVDDGFTPLPEYLQKDLQYIRRKPKENEGHTLVLNLEKAVPYIKGDKILIVEDDDWYGPNYIEIMSLWLNTYDLVGEGCARYYHLPTMKCRRIANTKHASLCQTGFRDSLLPLFKECVSGGDPYVDARFWNKALEHSHVYMDIEDKLKLHCAIKGLKGRKGIGTGHEVSSDYYAVDTNIQSLINWVGEENAKIYMKHVGQSFESALLLGSGKGSLRKAVSPKAAAPVIIKPPSVRRVPIKEVKTITVITTTGDRPLCFDLLRKWMAKQTIKPDQWIVVDDGKEPTKAHKEFEYYRREPTSQDYLHTLCLNLPIALDKVKSDKILIMEDDDWYSPIYIEYMSKLLDSSDLVGFRNLIFYYPSLGMYMEKGTIKQPALAQTAFRGSIIPIIKEICSGASKDYDLCGKGLVDAKLWKHSLQTHKKEESVRLTTDLKTASGKIVSKGAVFNSPIPHGILQRAQRKQGAEIFYNLVPTVATKSTVVCDRYLAIGMKGMPGRKGLTSHHDPNNKKYKKDEGFVLLESIIKKDITFYSNLFS